MPEQYPIFRFFSYSASVLSIGSASPVFVESSRQYIGDAVITAKVKEGILDASQLKVMPVKVDKGAVLP